MQKKSMYYDVNHTRICRDHYKAGFGVTRLFKNIWTVLMYGSSPIAHSARKRKIH